MIEIPFLITELTFTAIWLIVRISIWVREKKIDWRREAVLLLMFINLAVIIRYVFFPRDLIDGKIQPLVFEPGNNLPLRINLKPFIHLLDYDCTRNLLWNIAGNAAMFIPSGIVLPIVYKRLNSLGKVLIAGGTISLCIEILQLPFAARATDIDDLILNCLGVAIGYGIYMAVSGTIHLKKETRK